MTVAHRVSSRSEGKTMTDKTPNTSKTSTRWSSKATQVSRFAVVREAPKSTGKTSNNILRSKTSKVGKSRFA